MRCTIKTLTVLLLLLCAGAAALSFFWGADGDSFILLHIRLPRILLGALAGAALASSGTVMQAALQNPLADPYILGTSAGAALGSAAATAVGAPFASFAYYAFVLAGAAGTTLVSYIMAQKAGRTSPLTLILSGIAVSSFAGAVLLFLLFVKRGEALSSVSFLMGTVTEGSAPLYKIAPALFAAGFAGSLLLARQLDILSLGEGRAAALGVRTERVKAASFACAILMTGAAVSAAGTVGFVGLIVPHAIRLLAPAKNRLLLPASALGGAALLVSTDFLARVIIYPAEIPCGVLTALLGAPFFIWLMNKTAR